MNELATPDDRDAAAGEYVLGTLDDADRAAFEAALASDPALQAQVYAWQDRLLGLSRLALPRAPAPTTWARLARAVEAAAADAPRDAAAGDPFVAVPAVGAGATVRPPAGAARDAPGGAKLRWWERLALWQGLGAVSVAASLVLGVLMAQRAGSPPPARYLAVLQSPQDRSTGWIVEVETDRTVRLVPLAGATAPGPGRSLQFWTKPEGAAGPTSLGLVRTGTPLEWPVARLPAIGAQTLFEITLEPEHGSPIGRPTGPILYVGRTVRL